MKLTNSVRNKIHPWFMDSSEIQKNSKNLPSEIRHHTNEIIENGFTVIKKSIPKEKCTQAINSFKRFSQSHKQKFEKHIDADGHYPRIINLHTILPELFSLFSDNSIAYQTQLALFGATPCLYTSLFYERGSAQPAHRDSPYFSTRPEHFYLGVWVALEDATKANGALQVFAGGHKLPELNREEIAKEIVGSLNEIPPISNELFESYRSKVEQQCLSAGLTLQTLDVEAGDTVIWHPQLPHGGGAIEDITRTRFSLVMHTTPVGVPVYHQDKFFNPKAPAPMDAPWEYEQIEGFYRVQHTTFNIGHQEAFEVSDFSARPQEDYSS